MCHFVFAFVLACLLARPLDAYLYDYCDPNLCPNKTHTLCKYKKCELSEKCGVCSQLLEIDAETIHLILHNVNTIRNMVALGEEKRVGNVRAANMIVLKYHEELAMIAQCWANQCTSGNDQCRATTSFDLVGQTIATTVCTDNTITDTLKMINDWYEGINFVETSVIRTFRPNQRYNDFTQLIWAETSFIGCGRVLYEHDNTSSQMLVCNFATGGNIVNQPVYIEGEPTTQCKLDYVPDNKYTGLCTWAKGYNNEAVATHQKSAAIMCFTSILSWYFKSY